MPRITNWSRESRSPALAYRNTEPGARAGLHRAPDAYRYEWRGAILVDGYPIWSRRYETNETAAFREPLRQRPAPDLKYLECPNDDVRVDEKTADGAKVQHWYDCPECGYEARVKIVQSVERGVSDRWPVFFSRARGVARHARAGYPMSLEVLDRHNEALFEFPWCPVCGQEDFKHIPFEGVFCTNCDTRVRLQELADTRGYEETALVHFNTDTTWNLHIEEKPRQDLPDGSARAVVVGAPGAYTVTKWIPRPSEDWEPVERGEFDDVEEPDEVSHLV